MTAEQNTPRILPLIDLHCHILCGADDGARDAEEMHAMLDAAYADGVRILCVTPHYHPGYFGENRMQANASMEDLRRYARKYPDLTLCFGNEIRYGEECVQWLRSGACATLNGSDYVLVDFLEDAAARNIVDSMFRVLNTGYRPILAHAERYRELRADCGEIRYLRENGVLIQIDADSPFLQGWERRISRKLLRKKIADLVGSDAHGLVCRASRLADCAHFVRERYGADYEEKLFWENPRAVLGNEELPGNGERETI